MSPQFKYLTDYELSIKSYKKKRKLNEKKRFLINQIVVYIISIF